VDALLAPFYVLVGFIGGTILLTQLVRWGMLVWVSTTQHGGDFLGAPKRRLLWVLPFVAALHPAPYILVGVSFGIYRLVKDKSGAPIIWMLTGLLIYVAFAALSSLAVLRRRRRAQAAARP
jgi:hypothetical protein